MITCIAIDDEPLGIELLQTYCKRIPDLVLKATFTNIQQAKEYIVQHPDIEVIFLDIQMPDMNGIEFYKTYCANKWVVFTTAYSEYALEGFNMNAIDYLLKPFDFSRFTDAYIKILEAYQYKNQIKDSFCVIKTETKVFTIPEIEIAYFESKDDYVKLVKTDDTNMLCKITTKGLMMQLSKNFVRVHRSYIIHVHHVKSISSHEIKIGKIQIPIGKMYKEDIQKIFT